MIIKRIVDGKEIEFKLTTREIIQAHEEYELDCTIDDVTSIYEQGEYDVDLSEEQLEEVAKLALHNLSKNDGYYESYWMSVEYTIDQYIDDKKNKEEV
jgi:hypothetical protein